MSKIDRLISKGDKLVEKKEYKKAVNMYKKALELDSNYADIYNSIGICYSKINDFETAIKYYKKANEIDPSEPVYVSNIIIAYYPDNNNKDILIDYGKKYYSLVNGNIKNEDINFRIGRAYFLDSCYNEAVEFLHNVHGENDLLVNKTIAWSYYYLNENEKAKEYFFKSLNYDKKDQEIYIGLAEVHINLELFDIAIGYFKEAEEIQKLSGKDLNDFAYTYMNNYLINKNMEDLKQAELRYKHAIKIGNNSYDNIIDFYIYKKEFENAIKYVEEGFKKNIKFTSATNLNILGNYFFNDKKDYSTSMIYYKKALEILPNDEIIKQNLKNAEMKLNNKPADYEKQEIPHFEEILQELNKFIGMDNIKNDINALIKQLEIYKIRKEQGLSVSEIYLHTVFKGPPGTGKTTVARLLGGIYKGLGLLEKGHVVEVDRSELVAEYIGQTAIKTEEIINKAKGGILFIDEAYTLAKGGNNDFGKEAINTILKHMEDDRKDFCLVVAGYPKEMSEFINTNPGLKSRFNREFYFNDFNPNELLKIFVKFANDEQYKVTEQAKNKLLKFFEFKYKSRDKSFGNGRMVRNQFEEIKTVQSNRIFNIISKIKNPDKKHELLINITKEDVINATSDEFIEEKEQSLDDILKELNDLVGLNHIKDDVDRLIKFLQVNHIRKQKGLKTTDVSLHTVFKGPPGTGKTTIARILGKVFKKIGILAKGHVIEVDRSKLVAEYVGQTAIKTNKVIDKALHGVLFIDEAYTLVKGGDNDFGKEAIETLLKRIEDDRENLCVILAGYQNEIDKLIKSNPGLESRFNRYFYFNHYNEDELIEIYKLFSDKIGYKTNNIGLQILYKYFQDIVKSNNENFGNGRFVRNLLEKIIQNQSYRIAENKNPTKEMLININNQDIEKAISQM